MPPNVQAPSQRTRKPLAVLPGHDLCEGAAEADRPHAEPEQQEEADKITSEAPCLRKKYGWITAFTRYPDIRAFGRIQIHIALQFRKIATLKIIAPWAARSPSRSAARAGGHSPATRRRAALPAPGRGISARFRPAAFRRCRTRARPRRRRSR